MTNIITFITERNEKHFHLLITNLETMKKIKDIEIERKGNDIVKNTTFLLDDFERKTESEVVLSDVDDSELLDVVDDKIRNFEPVDSVESKKEQHAWKLFFRKSR